MVSRTSILETIPLVIANPTKIKSKSTIGKFESALFLGRTFLTGHPIIAVILLIISAIVGVYCVRKQAIRRRLAARGGILGNQNAAGFFQLETKEGFTGNSTGKVD